MQLVLRSKEPDVTQEAPATDHEGENSIDLHMHSSYRYYDCYGSMVQLSMLSGKDAKDGNDGKDAVTVSSEEWAQLRQERRRNKTSLDLMAFFDSETCSRKQRERQVKAMQAQAYDPESFSTPEDFNRPQPEPDANTENAVNSPEFLLIFWDNNDHRRSSLYCLCISKLLKSIGAKVESARKQVEQLDEVKQ